MCLLWLLLFLLLLLLLLLLQLIRIGLLRRLLFSFPLLFALGMILNTTSMYLSVSW